jgi:hypothetical protein
MVQTRQRRPILGELWEELRAVEPLERPAESRLARHGESAGRRVRAAALRRTTKRRVSAGTPGRVAGWSEDVLRPTEHSPGQSVRKIVHPFASYPAVPLRDGVLVPAPAHFIRPPNAQEFFSGIDY